VGLLAGGSWFLFQKLNTSHAVSIPLSNLMDGDYEAVGNNRATLKSNNLGENQIILPK
jgi:hypothetical protein